VLLALIRRLAAAHDVRVFALAQEPEPAQWDLCGARVVNVGARRGRFAAVAAIAREHRREPFDVLQAIWSGNPGFVAVAAGRLLGVPALVHVAGGELVALPEIGYGGCLGWKGRLRESLTLPLADAVTGASTAIVEGVARFGIRAARLPLGVDLGAWPPLEPRPRRASEPARLLHVASLNRVKDPGTLLRAFAALRAARVPCELDVAGEDTLGGAVQAQARELGVADAVHFHGFLPQAELRPLVESAHVLLVTSRHEAGPVAMLEAAVAGVPTVGTSVGQVADWAPDAAVAVPVGDPLALASAARRLLDDDALRLGIARRAQARAVAMDADAMAAQFEALYARFAART
jgi:glycosyltransferase involved in cell wall biosynthesis